MFNIGDRVVYTGKYRDYSERHKIGQLGTVATGHCSEGITAYVRWDSKEWSSNSCYFANLALVEPAVDETEAFFV